MRKTARQPMETAERELVKLIEDASKSRHIWQTWQDMVTAIACSICNAVDRTPERFQKREEQYAQAVKNLGGVEKPARMLDILTTALEQNPDQDLLGKVYMNLNLGNHWRGQFFTPYSISRMTAEINLGGDMLKAEVEEKGYVSVCDPCVGAGAMLIAAANAIKQAGINYQVHTVFVGQDVDQIVAMMAYIQLSLLGCPGYILVGDSLVNPPTGHVLFPQEKKGQEIWITPFFTHQAWEMRRIWIWMQEILSGTETTKKTVEKEHFFMFFNFDEEEKPMEKDKMKIAGQPGQEKVLEPAPSLKGQNPTPLGGETPQPKAGEALEEKTEGNAKNPGEGTGETKEKRKVYTSGPEKIRDEAEVEYQEAEGEEAKAFVKAKMEKVVKYISEKCKADPEYNALVIQDHKTWKRCEQSMKKKAEKMMCARYGMMMVDDSICFGWMDEYYQADDLAEVKAEEEEARKEAERKERLEKEETKRAAKAKKKPAKAVPGPEKKEEKPKQQPKPKKNNGDIDGQMDLFSMMGM